MEIQGINKPNQIIAAEKNPPKNMRYPFAVTRLPMCWRTPDGSQVWSPLIEIFSDEDKITVRAEAPGIRQEDIYLSLVGNDLIIQGERRADPVFGNKDYISCEIAYGKFSRSVSLPVQVRKAGIKASYRNGMLEIELPKDHSKNANQVNIKLTRVKPTAASSKFSM